MWQNSLLRSAAGEGKRIGAPESGEGQRARVTTAPEPESAISCGR